MVLVGILLIVAGVADIGMSTMAFGDIGIAILVAGISSILSGLGFLIANGKIKKLSQK